MDKAGHIFLSIREGFHLGPKNAMSEEIKERKRIR